MNGQGTTTKDSNGPGRGPFDSSRADSPLRRRLLRLIFFVALPLIICAVFYDSNVDGSLDMFHEGESLAPSSETLLGKLPFRDIYLQHGWGVNLLRTRLAFSLFGVSVESNRRLSMGDVSGYFVPLVWVGVYLLLYSLFRNKLWIIPAFGLLVSADVLINERHLLPFLSMALLAVGRRGSRTPLFFSGALAASAVFYSLDTGLYALAIGGAFLLLIIIGDENHGESFLRSGATTYCLGALAGALPFVAYLILNGILDDFLLNCYLQLKFQKETWGIASPSLKSLAGPFENSTARNRAIYLVIKWYYPVFVYACTSLILLLRMVTRKLSDDDTALLLCTLAGIVFYRSAVGRSDEGHLMYAIGPFWILNICFIERVALFRKRARQTPDLPDEVPRWLHRLQRPRLSYLAVCLVTLGLIFYFWATCRNGGIVSRRLKLRVWEETTLADNSLLTLNVARAGRIHVSSEQAKEIEGVVAFIKSHTKPGEPIFDFSNQGAYYFLAERSNPIPYCQIAYAAPATMQAEALKKLTSSPPELVLMRENESHRPTEQTPLIYEWIKKNYREAERIGANIILLRKHD